MARKWLIPILIVIGVFVFSSQGLKGGPEISVNDAMGLLKTEPHLAVIDVRERADYDQGHLPGAISGPFAEFEHRLNSLKLAKAETVVLYSADDARARDATKLLYDKGYQGALILRGGIDAWRAAGLVLEKAQSPKPAP